MLKKVKLVDLKPMKDNVKNHPTWQIERIVYSIEKYGYLQKIVVDEENTILIGHGRYEALKEMGWDELEVEVKEGLTEKEKKALAILDNKSISLEWNEDVLARDLPKLADDALETGFSEKEIKDLIAKMMKAPEAEIEPVYDMTPRLYEKYDYILLFFKNEMDFLNVSQILGLKKMRDRMKPLKVGLFRGIDGLDAVKKIREHYKDVG